MNDNLTTADITDAVRRIAVDIEALREALNAADRIMGDGDTGMTVASIVTGWQDAITMPAPHVSALLLQIARETRKASGSSLGSVLAIGIGAAARNPVAHGPVDRQALISMLASATDAIAERSGAVPGDKTILDSLLAIRSALADASPSISLADTAIKGAEDALDTYRSRPTLIGRARVYGEKSIGHDDPGMLAALLLLRATATA